MKKVFSLLLLFTIFLTFGCNNKSDTNSSSIDFSKYEGKVFYEYDFDNDYLNGKVIRSGFTWVDSVEYAIPNQETFDHIHEYDWFVPMIKITNEKLTWAWNSGFISIISSVDPFTCSIEYGVHVYDEDFILMSGRVFDSDLYEYILGDDIIIYDGRDPHVVNPRHVYYSEDYLKEKGVSFYNVNEVIDFNTLTTI